MSDPSRQHRAVVRLSRVDRERLERGEIADPTDALHLNDRKVTESAPREVAPSVRARDANEQRLLSDRPPHFGNL
ncbi:hypothetical protein VR010_00105 [Actinomycetaceae bacterium L2_0104]